jgi:DNA polymerase-3 subunit beta
MKLTLPAGVLLNELKAVQGRTRSATVDILRHIRFDVKGSRLTLTGHDMSASSEAYIDVDQPANGSCCLPADAIVGLVGSLLKEAHLELELDGIQVTIKSGRSRYKIPALSASDFPDALTCDGGLPVEISSTDVLQLFQRARQALDPKDSRFFGQGLYLHAADGILCSSGISLYHFVRFNCTVKLPELTGVIVPLSAADEIAKTLRDGGTLTVSERTISAHTAGRRYCSKLIEEKYPDYNRLLPPLADVYVDIDRLEAAAAVRRLTSIASPGSVVDMCVGEGEIVLSLSGLGDGIETIQCSSEGKVVGHVSIAAERFVEALEIPTGEILQLHFNTGSMFVRIHDPSEPTMIFVESGRVPKGFKAAA